MTLVVCGDHGTPAPPQDWPGGEVVVIPDLCGDPSALVAAGVSDPEALILHVGEFDLGFVQGAIRSVGGDPLGVPIVTLADMPSTEQMYVLASGVVARHAAFPGAGPEHAKMRWPELMSRRRLFTLGVPQYIGAPSIDRTLCAADHGCRLCVDACPASALACESGSIKYAIDTCVACGICVTTCPTGATVNPTVTDRQIAAQVSAMVRASQRPIGIEFRCRDARPGTPVDGWYSVELACNGMLTLGWILAPLVLGAGAVAAPVCGENGCSLGNDDVVNSNRSEAARMLESLQVSKDRIRLKSGGVVPDPVGYEGVGDLTGLRDAQVVLALAERAGGGDIVFASTSIATGIVSIDEAACTLCEQCTTVCPPAALTVSRSDGAIEISFDPFLCVGCGMCVTRCPEQVHDAISVGRRLDVAELKVGNRVVRSGSTSSCEACGGPIAPSAMLERIQSMLGPEHAGTLDLISRRCLSCR